MSVLINSATKVICQGFTLQTRAPSTPNRLWTTARKSLERVEVGKPISICRSSTPWRMLWLKTGADASVIYVPPPWPTRFSRRQMPASSHIVTITEDIFRCRT